MRWKMLRRSVPFAAMSAAALIAVSPVGAALDEEEPPQFEGKSYCVGGETVVSRNRDENRQLKNDVERGGFWAKPDGKRFRDQSASQEQIEKHELSFVEVSKGPCALPSEGGFVQGAPRAGFCSVVGNTNPDGTAIPAGTFLNLELDQSASDPHYEGAVPAIYVQGIGITCDPPPAGFSFDGSTLVDPVGEANGTTGAIYPYYRVG